LSYPRTENPDFYDDPEGHKVNSGIQVLDAVRSIFPELLEADLVGHSEGGSNASRACLEYPEEFRTLIVMASGGLIKDDNITKITLRALSNPQLFIRSTGQLISHPKYSLNLFSNTSSYVRQNALKARKEAVRTASAYIAPRFPVISEKKGIPTGALQFLGDVLFPLKLVKKSTDNGSIFDLFVEYPYDDATHITPQNHPRTVAQTTLRMMEELLEIRDLRLSS
jgi:pimeloyl-ACP methyl ester carboxylesterase